MILKKYIAVLIVVLIVASVCLTRLSHDLVAYLYVKNYTTSKSSVSWGILLHYAITFFYPLTLIVSGALLYKQHLKIKKIIMHLPISILLSYLVLTYFNSRPLRVSLLVASILSNYILVFSLMAFLKKQRIKV